MTYFHIRLMSWNDALKCKCCLPLLYVLHSVFSIKIFLHHFVQYFDVTHENAIFFLKKANNKIINVLQTVAFSKIKT